MIHNTTTGYMSKRHEISQPGDICTHVFTAAPFVVTKKWK